MESNGGILTLARLDGISNFSSKKVADLLEVARVPPAVVQVECHPVWQQPKLHALCKSKGIHSTGFSPLASPGTGIVKTEVLKNPVLVMVAEKLGKFPAQIALRWGMQMDHSVLPKSTNEVRIKENFVLIGLYQKTCLPGEADQRHFFCARKVWCIQDC
ncbi:hypothetical protein CRYUN_Cryun16bG0131900 [Craigia yunnanensis]